MKFSELEFKHEGCCGTHTWAKVTHPSGIHTEVYDSDDDNSTGPFNVATFAGKVSRISAQMLPDQAAVEARLASDALLRP